MLTEQRRRAKSKRYPTSNIFISSFLVFITPSDRRFVWAIKFAVYDSGVFTSISRNIRKRDTMMCICSCAFINDKRIDDVKYNEVRMGYISVICQKFMK